MRLPKTALLRHTLIIGGETMGERIIRQWPNTKYADDMRETLMYFPPTKVSILEFEETMCEVNASRAKPCS